jgi:hypothetical protein
MLLNVASAMAALYDARRSAPRLRSQPRPAIGGTQADQRMEISAIGGECLAEQGHAHRTLALAGVSCHRESSAAATDSDGPMASGRVRSPVLVECVQKSLVWPDLGL